MKQIETNRLILRALTTSDTKSVFENWASDPDVTEYLTWNAHQSIADTEQIMEFWLSEYMNNNCYRYGIERKEDGELIGMIDVVGYHHGNPVLGYCSGKRFWNNGYMTEALSAVVDQLLSDGFDTIVVEAVKENVGSNCIIEKAGFEFVGSRITELSTQKPQIVTINSYRLYNKNA